MPTIPVSPLPTELPSVSSTQGAPATLLGAAGARQRADLGSALQSSGAEVQQAVERFQLENDRTAVKEAQVELEKRLRGLLYDPERGYYTLQGKTAFQQHAGVVSAADQARGEVEATLSNPRQQRAFAEFAAQRLGNERVQMSKHAAAQRSKWMEGVSMARIDEAAQAAVANPFDDVTFRRTIKTLGEEVNTLGELRGLDTEQREQLLRQAASPMVRSVVARLADIDPARAEALADASRELLQPQDQVAIDRLLEEGSTRAQGQDAADRIMSTIDDPKEQLAAARKIKNAKVRDNVVQRINARQAENVRLREAEQRDLVGQAFQLLIDQPEREALPFEVWEGLDGQNQKLLTDYMRSRHNGDEIETDWEVYSNLMRLAVEDPKAFRAERMYTHRLELADSQFIALTNLQAEIIQAQETAAAKPTKLTTLQTPLAKANAALDDMKIKRDSPQAQRFRDAVQRELDVLGREATAAEIDEIVDRLSLEGEVISGSTSLKRLFVDPDKRFFQVDPGETFQFFAEDIKEKFPTDYEQIVEALRKRGLDVNDENVSRMFMLHRNL